MAEREIGPCYVSISILSSSIDENDLACGIYDSVQYQQYLNYHARS